MKKLLLSLCLSLSISLSINLSKADEHTLTTGNLITNGNFETGNANGWTQTGQGRAISDCCTLGNKTTSNYDYEFGDTGSISQQFNLVTDDITQTMLNNGITLNSSIEVQNGECGVAGCWGGSGPGDTFSNTLKIKDPTGKTLAEVTQIRTDITNIYGQDFTDQLIYTGINSHYGDIRISGTDGNSPGNLGGPNVDNISVTMTYDPEVMPVSIQNELINTTENISTEFREIERFIRFEKFEEEFNLKEEFIMEEPKFTYREEFKEPEIFEVYKSPPMENEIKAEENFEFTKNEELREEFPETFSQEENLPGEAVEQKQEAEETSLQAEQPPNEEKNTSQEKEQEPPQRSKVVSKKTGSSSDDVKLVSLNKTMDKIDAKVKDIGKNLQIKNLVKINAMMDNSILLGYNKPFYTERKIYEDQISIQDNRVIYTASLQQYQQADPIFIKRNKIMGIRLQKQKLKQELEVLRNDGNSGM